jgi:hypothetical protein
LNKQDLDADGLTNCSNRIGLGHLIHPTENEKSFIFFWSKVIFDENICVTTSQYHMISKMVERKLCLYLKIIHAKGQVIQFVPYRFA